MKRALLFILAAVVVFVGCRRMTRFLPGAPLELPQSRFPATPIAANDLAADHGGFSNNDEAATLQELQVVFNDRDPTSDSDNQGADASALVFFITGDGGSTPPLGREHVFVSHWGGNSFTPPVEITGVDRDEAQILGSPLGTHAASVLLIPLNTAVYKGQDGLPDANVREKQGDWAIVWDAETATQSPELSNGPQADANGAHHTLFVNFFIASLERTPLGLANVGGDAATECHYGFQVVGTEAVANRGGASAGGMSGAALQAGFVDAGSRVFRPAEDVVSYGAATDAFVHCAHFGSTVVDPSGLASGGTEIGNVNGGRATLGAEPAPASYRVGDDMSFLQLFWVQLVTSHATTANTFEDTTGTGTVQIGPTFQLFTANVDLATLTLSSAVPVPFPAQRGSLFSALDARRLGATQALTSLTVYDNFLFWNYVDVSLQVPVSSGGTVEAQVGTNPGGELASSLVLSEVVVAPLSFGLAALVPVASQEDVTLLGTGGRHSTLASTPPGSASPVDRGEEQVAFDPCAPSPVIGPDEGQRDVVAFVIGRVSTLVAQGGGTAGDTDRELWAVAFAASGSGAGVLELMPQNPKRISAHVPELPAGPILHDDVFDLKIQSSRDGTYDLLAWRQLRGTSELATLGLAATVYKPWRDAAQTLPPALDARFPASPLVLDASPASLLEYAGPSLTLGEQGGLAGSPVAAYDFQGHVGYHCGFQSDPGTLSIVWLYSDGTDAHLFVASLRTSVGVNATDAPTLAELAPAEIDAAEATVPATAVNVAAGVPQSSFRFVPGSFGETIPTYSAASGIAPLGTCSSLLRDPLACRLDSVDGGFEANGTGGSVLLAFTKIVAATAGNWDRQLIGVLFNQAIEGRAVLSRSFPESASVNPPRPTFETLTLPNGGGIGVPVPYPVPVGFRTQLLSLVPNRSSFVIAPAAYQPDNGTYVYMNAPVTPEPDSAAGLFTRHFHPRLPLNLGPTLPSLGANLVPPASALTTDTGFEDPLRLDNSVLDSDALFFTALHRGREVVVLFSQDNHVWGTLTSDGESYLDTDGRSTLSLVDDNTSANSTQGLTGLGVFRHVDPRCDDRFSTILVVKKDDLNLNPRLYVRVME